MLKYRVLLEAEQLLTTDAPLEQLLDAAAGVMSLLDSHILLEEEIDPLSADPVLLVPYTISRPAEGLSRPAAAVATSQGEVVIIELSSEHEAKVVLHPPVRIPGFSAESDDLIGLNRTDRVPEVESESYKPIRASSTAFSIATTCRSTTASSRR